MSRLQVVRSLIKGLRALAVLAALLGSASAIEAQTVITLAWDANTEPDLAGYQVSWGTQSGVYSTIVDVGNVTSRSFPAPPPGVVHYYAVKAYNSASPRQYSPYSAEVNTGLVINRAPTLVQPTNQTSAENANISLQLVASDPDGNPLTYSATGLPASLTVNATTGLVSGTLTYTSAGSYTVTATVSDGALSNSRTFTWTVTDVVVPTPVLTWPAPASITQGTALSATQLNATASVPGTFVYAPASGTVLPAGTHTLGVTFTPTDTTRYTTATASTTLVVTVPRTTPTVSWATPAAITQGTALGATQLNATASVPGSFVYAPAAGTVLAAGTHTLGTTFTPTDTTRYTTATASTTLVVTGPGTTPVLGTADFNGDGKPDILWRNATTGENCVWFMDGVTRTGWSFLPRVADLNWQIVGTADFDGDGKPDILWRNATTGENTVWFMDGVTRTGWSFLPPVADLNWKIVGTADSDGDGKPDILWRNATTGENCVWFMNGVTRTGWSFLPPVADLNWKIGQQQ